MVQRANAHLPWQQASRFRLAMSTAHGCSLEAIKGSRHPTSLHAHSGQLQLVCHLNLNLHLHHWMENLLINKIQKNMSTTESIKEHHSHIESGRIDLHAERPDDLKAIAEEGHVAPFDEHGHALAIRDEAAERRLRWKVGVLVHQFVISKGSCSLIYAFCQLCEYK